MKQNKIIGLIWLLIAVVLCYVMVATMGRIKINSLPFININNKGVVMSSELTDTFSYPVDSIRDIEIYLKAASVYFEEASDNKITVELYFDNQEKPTVGVVGKVLKIANNSTKSVVTFGRNRVVVKIPSSVDLNDIDVSTLSGSVSLLNLDAKKIDGRSASGSVSIENCKADSIDVQSQSGSVKINSCSAKKLDGKSTSGSVKADGAFSQVSLHSTSGSVRADLDRQLEGDSEISAVSGSVHVVMPRKSNMEIKYSTVSGSYKNSLTGTSGKKGTDSVGKNGPRLILSTTSGSIKVE